MIITTTPSVEGREIRGYRGLVFGEAVAGVNLVRDFGASIRNVVGGRSSGYEEELRRAREDALYDMQADAEDLGADAVVGVSFDYEFQNGMLMVSVSGTAVVLYDGPSGPR